MMHLQVFVTCLVLLGAVAAAPNQLERVRRSDNGTSPQTRIAGGDLAVPGQLPYVCGIVQNGNLTCGCSIIASNYALTSAQCITPVPEQVNAKVVAGDLTAGEGVSFDIESIIPHPKFNPDTLDYDVAVIRTTSPIEGANIGPVMMVNANAILRDGIDYLVVGWGAVTPQGSDSPVLLKADVYLEPQSTCETAYASIGRTITPRMMCAGAPGKGPCKGDTGGPLVFQHRIHEVPDSPSFLDILMGITSLTNDCGNPALPGVFTRLSNEEVRDFVRQTANV